MKAAGGMARVSRTLAVLALAGTALAACGARSWLPAPGTQTDDSTACTSTDVPILPNVPNLYFVLDASGSMLENYKWAHVRSAVTSLVTHLEDRARFGATVFPAPGTDQCAAGVEVMPLRAGDRSGETASVFFTATALTPWGGTPTAATFRSLVAKFRDLGGVTYVILATDGGPNCDSDLKSCAVDQCTSNIDGVKGPDGRQVCFADAGDSADAGNCCATTRSGCLDGLETARAISELRAVGVPTYVMGIPGSLPYSAVLDDLAVAGGTPRASAPLYYAVLSPEVPALESALTDIANEVMRSCTLLLGRNPADPNKVNVSIDGRIVPSGGPNGWALHGPTVTLEGTTCGARQSDAALPAVHVAEGCPTIH
jgi:hypothetical protein